VLRALERLLLVHLVDDVLTIVELALHFLEKLVLKLSIGKVTFQVLLYLGVLHDFQELLLNDEQVLNLHI